ncbi:MAG: hypothetical protein AAGH41_12305 [Pseudomonadota bacterium]
MHSPPFLPYDDVGLRFRMNNRGFALPEITEYQLTDFTIRTPPSRLEAFAQSLESFAKLETNRLYWDDETEVQSSHEFIRGTSGGSSLRQSLDVLHEARRN